MARAHFDGELLRARIRYVGESQSCMGAGAMVDTLCLD
eukprot:COSAG05_NODE_6776_length_905_cov_1.047146_1_plen_37_part_10